MKTSFLSVLALVTVAVMAAALVHESRKDTRQSIAQTEQMMIAQANAIAEIVAESSLHGLEAYKSWESEAETRRLDNARWLAWVNSRLPLPGSWLGIFARDLGLYRILFYDAAGNLEKSAQSEPGAATVDPGLPPLFIVQVASGQHPTGVLGYRKSRTDGVSRLVVGAARPDGGAVITCARAGHMEKSRLELSPGHLIKTLGQARGLQYVVMQDNSGIVASSTTEISFPAAGSDPDLEPLTIGAPFVSREYDSSLGPVLEVTRLIDVGTQAEGRGMLLRVGLEADLLVAMRDDTRNRARVRFLLMAGSLILLSILLMVWQRQALLRREVRKVTNELRMREEEAQRTGKLAAMGNLAAGVAHEIRNPLNTIHMLAQSLGRNQELPGDITEKARHIRDESGRIEGIVQQFLDFARPRDPVLERLNLGQVVREAVAVHQAAHTGDGLVFEVDAPDCQAVLDRHFVVEIVDNLVRNAVEALDGRGTVAVQLQSRRDQAELTVEDTGPGVPPEAREKIFDLYFTTKPSGSGLGLSLVSRMVTAMEGHFSLDPEDGRLGGARFLVRFPLQRSQE